MHACVCVASLSTQGGLELSSLLALCSRRTSCDARYAYVSVYSQSLSFSVVSGSHGAAEKARWAVSWSLSVRVSEDPADRRASWPGRHGPPAPAQSACVDLAALQTARPNSQRSN